MTTPLPPLPTGNDKLNQFFKRLILMARERTIIENPTFHVEQTSKGVLLKPK